MIYGGRYDHWIRVGDRSNRPNFQILINLNLAIARVILDARHCKAALH